ncbi:MAG: hypothetical protein KKC05_02920, partial [Nanoarchaeota archaeon]|nr:hypothetical protein [Nanoarchaeota archaeon]
PKVKRRLLETAHRGWGYWDPASNTHVICSFDAVPEGHKYRELRSDSMHVRYQYADSLFSVPSRGRQKKYDVMLQVLPVTGLNDEYLFEWLKMNGVHVCEDVFFRAARGKAQDRLAEELHKYGNPERIIDAHVYGAIELVEDHSETGSDIKPVRLKFPRATGILGPWKVLKTATLVGTKTRAERPDKVEICTELGKVHGHGDVKVEELYDLSEVA